MAKKIFQKVGNTVITPISLKILLIFAVLLLLSNFVTNYINIQLNRKETIHLTNMMLVKELKEIYTTANNQYDISVFAGDMKSGTDSISASAVKILEYPHGRAFGITLNGDLLFQASKGQDFKVFPDTKAFRILVENFENDIKEGSFFFEDDAGEYLAVYKYHDKWNMFIVRADLMSDLLSASNTVFFNVSVIIIILTIIFMIFGYFAFWYILRFVQKISNSLYEMQSSQMLTLIDLKNAPNDDVTYLGMSFNTLSSSINNLMGIFRKFVSKDVVTKAYVEHHVNLEGVQRDLTILFSDIRGFTYMTETLGNDIINLLNVHYDRAIHVIHEQQGVIGSIIGDAVLAVYGTMNSKENKSLEALRSAWTIHEVVMRLRSKMIERKVEIESRRHLTESEERVFKAVLLDVGVGLDGGIVFYGTIGSSEHMTNTVIGDNVNSASRLEGLTRLYDLPVIVSAYIKAEVESVTSQYIFIEIDTVQVKGKTEGKQIFFPLDSLRYTSEEIGKYAQFSTALSAYYKGNWDEARRILRNCNLKLCDIFIERMGTQSAPQGWSGIWTMTSK